MTNLKSNIAYLTHFVAWRRDVSTSLRKADHNEMMQQLDFAIESLQMLEQIINDMATGHLVRAALLTSTDDERQFDSVANNGEAL